MQIKNMIKMYNEDLYKKKEKLVQKLSAYVNCQVRILL